MIGNTQQAPGITHQPRVFTIDRKPAVLDDAPVRIASPRPFRTEYFESTNDKPKDWSAVGHAATLRGAARACFTRLLDRRAKLCLVHDEDGRVIARIFREGRRIVAIGV